MSTIDTFIHHARKNVREAEIGIFLPPAPLIENDASRILI